MSGTFVRYVKKLFLPFNEKVTVILLHEFYELFMQSPLVLVDIGVATSTLPGFSLFKKGVKVIGFEPNKEAYDKLFL